MPSASRLLRLQVLERVLGELGERTGPRLRCSASERSSPPARATAGEARPVPEETRAANGHLLPSVTFEEPAPGASIMSPAPDDTAGRGREAAGQESDIDDDADAGLQQLFRRHPVEVRVVDDGDAVPAQPGRGVLSGGRAARPGTRRACSLLSEVEPAAAEHTFDLVSARPGELLDAGRPDRRHLLDPEVSFGPARDLGRCVIVITWVRFASRSRVSATPCAVVPPIPVDLVEDHGLLSTAAIASATREKPAGRRLGDGANGGPRSGGQDAPRRYR
jgi:hypothetical protein